jgi:O-antigen ligase
LAALILCLPLEFTATFALQPVARWVLLIVVIALVYLLLTRRVSLLLPRNPSLILLLAYVVVSLLSWVVTRAPGSYNSVLAIALYPLAGLALMNVARSQADHRRAWVAFAISGLGVAIVGAGLYLTNSHIWMPNPAVGTRMNITFGDPNITARFLTLGACAAVLLFAARQGPAWLAVAAAMACGVVLPVTFSRSGMALFPLMVLLAAVVALDHRRAAVIGAATLIAFALSMGINPDTRSRALDAEMLAVNLVTGGSQAGGPAVHQAPAVLPLQDNRTYLIGAGVKMFTDHPVTGVGFGGYQHALLTTYRGFLPSRPTDTVSHTYLVTVLAEQGLVGAVIFLAFLLQLGREAISFRQRRDGWATWSTIPAMLIIPIFLYSQFEGRFMQEPYLWVSLALLYSSHRLAEMSGESAADREPTGARKPRLEAA